MKKFKSLAIIAIATSTFFLSCKKDKNDSASQSCKVTKAYSYDNSGVVDDSISYVYTGDKVSKIQYSSNDYSSFDYTGANVTKRNYFSTSTSTTADYYDQVTYNADNTISKIENYQKNGSAYSIYSRNEFAYTSGKLSTLTVYNVTNGVSAKAENYAYTYTGNNITSVVYTSYDSTAGGTATVYYTYDNTANYLKKQNSQFFLIDPFLGIDYVLLPIGVNLPASLSANNVTSISAPALGFVLPLSYQLDDKQNLKSINQVNTPLISYAYQCP